MSERVGYYVMFALILSTMFWGLVDWWGIEI